MATPSNSSNPLHPSSASKKNNSNNNAAHTPAGPASSGPRSVPSPAAVRSSGKTPNFHSNNNKMGGTPMGMSLSSMGINMSMSPSYMAGFTPGSAAMLPSMSDLGLSSSSKRGDADAERRRKMRAVLKNIGKVNARVSEEGITRVARRVGFENDVDAEGEEARREREGERPISIAGKEVLIDVDMKGNAAQGVVVSSLGGVSAGDMEKVGKVLQELLVKGKDLGGFGRELDRIADLDRISQRGVSAFAAVAGVGQCLQTLYAKECEVVGDERTVLRKRSGRPWLHSRGRIGLGVDYWTTAPSISKDQNAMDVDSTTPPEEEDPAEFHTLHITAQPWAADLYPALRVSIEWLGEFSSGPPTKDDNDMSNGNGNENDPLQNIPWQDPPPTYIDPEDPTIQQEKFPDLRFLAKLEPPLVVSYQIAAQILHETGGDITPTLIPKEWLPLLTNKDAKGGVDALTVTPSLLNQDEAPKLKGSALVMRKDGNDIQHHYLLDVTKAEWGYRLQDLPFAHPRQILGLLPVLRQWSVFGQLVCGLLRDQRTPKEVGRGDDTLDSLLQQPPTEVEDGLRVSVEISTSPMPTLAVSFPMGKENGMGRVVVQVDRNADVVVSHLGGFGEGVDAARIARALEVCGEVGVWVEWMRGEMGM